MKIAWTIAAALVLPVFGACGNKPLPPPTSPTSTVAPVTPATPVTPVPHQQPSTGPIAFVSNRDGANAIYLANADGSGVTRLTSGEEPAWAPGGRRLAFERGNSTYVIGTDGSGEARVAAGGSPSWAPDGSALALSTTNGIYLVNVDGSGARSVIDPAVVWPDPTGQLGPYFAGWPSWSPDGRRIALVRGSMYDIWALYVLDIDGGTAPRSVAQNVAEKTAWSPDGSRIAFTGWPGIVRVVYADASPDAMDGVFGAWADWTPTGSLIFTRGSAPTGERIFLSTSDTALIPDAVKPALVIYADRDAVWAR